MSKMIKMFKKIREDNESIVQHQVDSKIPKALLNQEAKASSAD